MKFRTAIETIEWPFKLSYESKLAFMGSCFSNEISEKCQALGFQVLANPFGTVYNPVSLNQQLQIIAGKANANVLEHNGQFYCLDANTSFKFATKARLQKSIKETALWARDFIIKADVIFLTLGTSFVFTEKRSELTVANCHKLPASLFNRQILSQEALNDALHGIHSTIKSLNPAIHIVYTISPVRHFADGLVVNNLSKSLLRSAIHNYIIEYGSIFYFPSFEIIMDDLRDYRFYTEDLCHVNAQGVNYVWEHFLSVFNQQCQGEITEVEKYLQLKGHKPMDKKKHTNHIKEKKKKLVETIKGIQL